jgi:hypothetical protein
MPSTKTLKEATSRFCVLAALRMRPFPVAKRAKASAYASSRALTEVRSLPTGYSPDRCVIGIARVVLLSDAETVWHVGHKDELEDGP